MESPHSLIEKCRDNARRLVRDLYRPRETIILEVKPPAGRVLLDPGRKRLTVQVDPLLGKDSVTKELAYQVIDGYKRSRRLKALAEILSVAGLLTLGNLGKSLSGPIAVAIYLAAFLGIALIVAAYISNLWRKSRPGKIDKYTLQVVLGDPYCRAAIESIRTLLEWIMKEKEKHFRATIPEGKERIKWKKRIHIPLNKYREIIMEYPVLLGEVEPGHSSRA